MIKITIETTTYPKKNWGISKMEEFLTKYIVSTGDICSKCVCFFRKLKWLWLIGNKWLTRSEEHELVIQFIHHEYGYRQNWMTRSAVTIMNNVIYKALFTLWIINQGVLCEKMIKILIYCKNLQISRTIFPKIVARNWGCGLSSGTFEKGVPFSHTI